MLNMFVGVVVDNFQQAQNAIQDELMAKQIAISKAKILSRIQKRQAKTCWTSSIFF